MEEILEFIKRRFPTDCHWGGWKLFLFERREHSPL